MAGWVDFSDLESGSGIRTKLNKAGSDAAASVRVISAIAAVGTEIEYFITGTKVYSIAELAYYVYNGAAWVVDTDLVAISAADKVNYLHKSAGIIGTPPSGIIDNSDGTGDILDLDVVLYPSADFTGVPMTCTISGDTFTFVDGAREWVSADYNSGSPIFYKETVLENMNYSDKIPIISVWRVGTKLHSYVPDQLALGLSNKLHYSSLLSTGYIRANNTGLIISETTSPNPRTIVASAGTIFYGAVYTPILAVDSSASDLLTFTYNVSGVWTYADNLVYNNTQYDDGTDLVNAGVGKSLVLWYYRSVGDEKEIFYVLGDAQYNNPAAADLAQPRSDLPEVISTHCILVGRSIITTSATSGDTQSTFGISYTGSTVISHNDTANIQGGTTDEYYHMTEAQDTALNSGYTTPSYIALTEFEATPARASVSNIHGGIVSLANADPLDSGNPIAFSKGTGKMIIVVNAGSDLAGDIVITGTSVDRNTGATTPADTDTITVTGLTTDGTTTDSNGNSLWSFSDAYISSKWFTGSITLSTTDLTLTDVDVYHISFEQFNDQPDLVITTLDTNLFTTGVAAEYDCYLYSVEVTSGMCDITRLASLNLGADGETAIAGVAWRLRRGNINKVLNGTTDGIWVDSTYANNPSQIESVAMKVWAKNTQDVT